MKSFSTHLFSRVTASATLAILVIVTIGGCEVKQQENTILNNTDTIIDAIYSISHPEIGFNNYRYYSTLPLGDIDKNNWCTFCEIKPGERPRNSIYPFDKSDTIYYAARDADTNEFIFYQEFSYHELEELDWVVPITDQRR